MKQQKSQKKNFLARKQNPYCSDRERKEAAANHAAANKDGPNTGWLCLCATMHIFSFQYHHEQEIARYFGICSVVKAQLGFCGCPKYREKKMRQLCFAEFVTHFFVEKPVPIKKVNVFPHPSFCQNGMTFKSCQFFTLNISSPHKHTIFLGRNPKTAQKSFLEKNV